jgi:hypothetical protein
MAIAADTPIPTVKGWLPASQLMVGDLVFNENGFPQPILVLQSYIPTKMYRIHLDDGLTIAGDKHLAFYPETKLNRICVSQFLSRRRANAQRRPNRRKMALTKRSVAQLLQTGILNPDDKRYEYTIPTCSGLNYPYQDHPVPPFVVGLWFAAQRVGSTIKKTKLFHDHVKERLRDVGYQVINKATTRFSVKPPINQSFLARYVTIPKLMPREYLTGTAEQRTELLAGIMCSDDYNYDAVRDMYYYRTRDKAFCRVIQNLCESLGIRTMSKLNSEEYKIYEVRFRTEIPLVPNRNPLPRTIKFKRRTLRKIEEIKPFACVHIETEGQFLAGEGYIPCL